MLTFHLRFVEMPLACGLRFAIVGAGLCFSFAHASGQKPSPAAIQPTSPAIASSPQSVPSSVIGQVVQFTSDSERYRVSGWSKTEGNFTWTEGTSARLALPIPVDAGPLTVKMTLLGLTQPPALPFQPVEVYVKDRKVAEWQVSASAQFTAEIPAELTKGMKTLNVEFRIPKATSPKALGMNTDIRTLGICAYSLELKRP
jgi:hypothetical protein